MSYAWEQQDGERILWYSRFVEFYLTGGPERSIDAAYRAFRARQALGSGKAPSAARGGAPGSWNAAARKACWHARAKAWDAHEAMLLRKAYSNTIKRANEKHLAVVAANFNKLIEQTRRIDYSSIVHPGELLEYAERLIKLERMLLGMPLQVEEVRQAASADPGVARAIQESSTAERVDTPELVAEVYRILHDQGAFDDPEADRQAV